MAENDTMSAARILVKRTVSTDPEFQALVKLLDQDLARQYREGVLPRDLLPQFAFDPKELERLLLPGGEGAFSGSRGSLRNSETTL